MLDLFDELGDGGLTLVIVTHEEHVAAHADRRVRMIDGRLTEERRVSGAATAEPARDATAAAGAHARRATSSARRSPACSRARRASR